ncbi:MAG: hypothetical protein OHK0047_29390 [Leptolyngbyaceae cyanobacterium]
MGRRQWLEDLITSEYLPKIANLKNTSTGRRKAADLAQQIRDSWTRRGLKTLSQQQGLMDQTRRAIKDEFGDDHFSLDYIKFSEAEYIELNNQKQGAIADRNESVTYIDNPDAIVGQAVRLLDSPEWADICAGLAVLTGRRSSELLSTAEFEPKTKWSVTFTGALKRRGELQTLSFEIPTLTTAQKVCTALKKVRALLPEARSLTTEQVNSRYGKAVAKACEHQFGHLVPKRPGKDTLYTHLFRSIYATIATFWYCPPNLVDWEFKAAIQGHFQILDEQNPELRRSLTASRHYSDYEIADAVIAQYAGKRKGIKLGSMGVEPIEMFQQKAREYTPTQPSSPRKVGSLRYFAQDHDRWTQVMTTICPNCHNQQERMAKLLEWIEARLADSPASVAEEQEPQTIPTPTPVAAPKTTMTMPVDPAIALMERMTQVMEQLGALTAVLSEQTVATRKHSTPTKAEAGDQAQMPTPRSSSEPTATTINHAIDAIMAYNNAPDRLHDQKWAITINALKSYAQSQHTILRIMKERRAEIDAHHAQHQIDATKHNHRHKRKHKITDVIAIA